LYSRLVVLELELPPFISATYQVATKTDSVSIENSPFWNRKALAGTSVGCYQTIFLGNEYNLGQFFDFTTTVWKTGTTGT
jgi:hypothetical protein